MPSLSRESHNTLSRDPLLALETNSDDERAGLVDELDLAHELDLQRREEEELKLSPRAMMAAMVNRNASLRQMIMGNMDSSALRTAQEPAITATAPTGEAPQSPHGCSPKYVKFYHIYSGNSSAKSGARPVTSSSSWMSAASTI